MIRIGRAKVPEGDRGGMRRHQVILIVSTVLGSWLGMQAIHELGHCLGAWLTGGRVARIVLHPLAISRTDLAENHHPLAVAWSGPVGGVLLPLTLWGPAALARSRVAFILRFFAGFCLVANGAYLAIGSFDHVGDAGDLLRLGAPAWQLWAFGVLAVPAGFWLWHGEGRCFGMGEARGRVDRGMAYVSLVILALLVILGLIVGGG
jgi:hypothetical protein